MTLPVLQNALVFLLWAAPASARLGVVETRDGRLYEGHVRLESNAIVVVNASKDLWIQVPLTNLAGLSLERDADPASSGQGLVAASQRGGLPALWRHEDIGSANLLGSADWAWGKVLVRSSGTNIAADSDAFHFVFKPVNGDSEIVARVLNVRVADAGAKAGLMMRASLAADSPNLFFGMGTRAGFLQWREDKGGSTQTGSDPDMRPPYWIRLKRDVEAFTAFMSRDGRHWIATRKIELPIGREMFVGLAVSGGQSGFLNRALFDRVEEAPALRNRWFVPRVNLKSGSVAAGHIVEMDDTMIRFQDENGARSVPVHEVVNLRFQLVPERFSALVASGRPGALLSTGQFLDGDCRGIKSGKVTISSVLMGLRRFDIHHEVIAVILRRAAPAGDREYVAYTDDGSVWFASAVEMDGQVLVLRESSLGLRRVLLHQLVELRRRS